MKTTIGVLLFACVLIGLSAGQTDINGSWTTYYGGNFYLCADDVTGEVNGVYSELGYIKGTLSGSSLSGYWFQTGLNVADLNGRCCTANRGTFSFTFSSATSFYGTYLFEDTMKSGELWKGTQTSSFNPQTEQCWSPKEILTKSIEGRWESDNLHYWDQCIDPNGVWTASYEYGSSIRGYIFGQCFFNGQFCHGDWFEPNQVTGGYMVRLLANDEMIGTWWQFNASDIDSSIYNSYSNNPYYHNTETRYRLGEAISCSRNKDLFVKGGSRSPPPIYTYTPISSPVTITRPELGFEAIIGIIFAAVGSTIVGITVLICLFCRPQCSGGRGGGAYRHHATRTRRHGFGTTHRRFGGGYS